MKRRMVKCACGQVVLLLAPKPKKLESCFKCLDYGVRK